MSESVGQWDRIAIVRLRFGAVLCYCKGISFRIWKSHAHLVLLDLVEFYTARNMRKLRSRLSSNRSSYGEPDDEEARNDPASKPLLESRDSSVDAGDEQPASASSSSAAPVRTRAATMPQPTAAEIRRRQALEYRHLNKVFFVRSE